MYELIAIYTPMGLSLIDAVAQSWSAPVTGDVGTLEFCQAQMQSLKITITQQGVWNDIQLFVNDYMMSLSANNGEVNASATCEHTRY